MNTLLRPFALAAPLLLALPSASAQEGTTIAVLDLQDKGVGPDLASTLSEVLTVSLSELGVFRVLSRADIQKMIEHEMSKQVLGCEDDTSCLAEIGGALGVALLVSGSVGKVGEGYIVNLTLTDAKEAKVRAREQREVASAQELTEQVKGAVRILVRELLAGHQGELILQVSQSAAEVEIDGRTIGVTPLARQTLAGGPHALRVHKKGFVTWARDVDIRKNEATVIDATMVPSQEFIDDYDSSARTWRALAWTSAGVGAALAGFGVGGYLWNADRAGAYERDLVALQCGVRDSPIDPASCTQFAGRRADIETFQLAVIGGLAGGAVLAVVSAVLFAVGPEVGAYDHYRTRAEVGVVPVAGGAAASVRVGF